MMDRFFDFLNTPMAVLVVLVVVVGINAFIYFGQRPPETPAPPPAGRGENQTTSVERTGRRAGAGEATLPATTPRSTTPARPSASATVSATATASAASSP